MRDSDERSIRILIEFWAVSTESEICEICQLLERA